MVTASVRQSANGSRVIFCMSLPHFDLMVSISFLNRLTAAQLVFTKKKVARGFLLSLHLKKVRTVSQGTSDGITKLRKASVLGDRV